MKILFLIRRLSRGGAERQLIVLAKGLQAKGHDVHLAVLYDGGGFEQEIVESGIALHQLNKKGFWDIFAFFKNYWKLLKLVKPDIIHGYLQVQNMISVAGKFTSPQAKVVWGLRDSIIGHGKIKPTMKIIFYTTCFLSNFADLIIPNSEAGKKFYIENNYPKNLINVVPNGIDTIKFRFNAKDRSDFRKRWGLDESDFIVGYVARLDPVKSHESFFQSVAIARRTHPAIKIVCVGGGSSEYQEALSKYAIDLQISNSLVWAGECSNMAGAYSALDINISSSASEGFPNSIAEAMSCGVPVVATDVGDNKIILDGIGICVPANDPDALANGILDMMGKDLKDVKAKSRQRILDYYSVDKLVERTEHLLLGLLEAERRSVVV